MYEFLLVPVDGSESSIAALDHALDVAADHGATVQLLYVADTNKPSLVRYEGNVVDVLEEEGEEILSDARDRAKERGVPVVDDVVQGQPRSAIVDAAAEGPVDLVVMGTHGHRGLKEYVLGSVAEGVVNESEPPVLAVRTEDATRYPYENVLVPTDGSDHARTALRYGAEIAARHDATLHLLSVVDEPTLGLAVGSTPTADRLEEQAREVLEEATSVATNAGVDDVETAIEFGSVSREITSVADAADVDLVVMGTHGRTGLDQHLLGSVTERVLRTAPVPVLTTNSADAGGD
ncbi:universal stress protein [Halosolutus amylolyticus]|uniref:Universal stress protein n=1 Tax=Halosolutus amylolyticus TaxID=2932267 RepID=A0ABD5PMQ6_9EURY|nr:universal stress protein [Halosolutus amylolyticus]